MYYLNKQIIQNIILIQNITFYNTLLISNMHNKKYPTLKKCIF